MNLLDKYMAAPLLKNSGHFDILSWRRGKKTEYHVLKQIAQTVLAIQVSTVASEFAFGAGGRVIDAYCNRLGPNMVESLIIISYFAATMCG